MVHLYRNFLESEAEYRLAESYWMSVWDRVERYEREKFDWSSPWVSTGAADYLDGNPIFSALSPVLQRGLRIIQYEPTSPRLEIQAWPSTFGGEFNDPSAINELVIACALSEETARIALDMISHWVAGRSVRFENRAGILIPRGMPAPVETFEFPFDSAA